MDPCKSLKLVPRPPLTCCRAGRLDPEAAVALGVMPGEDFSRLNEGIAVLGRHGDLVQPEQVVGPPRRGRRWAVVGSCQDSSDFARSVGEW